MNDGPFNSRPTSLLLVVAAATEASAVRRGVGLDGPARAPAAWQTVPLAPGADLLLTGVGKANAAGAVATTLALGRHGLVVNLGIAGALPAVPHPAAIGSVVFAESSVFADEGVQTEASFRSLASLGWGIAPDATDAIGPHADLAAALRSLASVHGPVATVSTCSGTDALAAEVVARTGAVAEAMEGAAVLLAASRVGVPAVELRVISNTTGDRARQRWDLATAMDRLATLAWAVVESIPVRMPGA
ncbi:MAG: futalosine hydrolase [Phycisphaerae bacterium]